MRVEFHENATDEYELSLEWYRQRSTVAGNRFIDAIDSSLTKIAQDPMRYAKARKECRAISVKRYPFQIIYRIESERIMVYAVAHVKRKPGYWANRLGD